MSKNDFKKKVCKNENLFFFNFFLTTFFLFLLRQMVMRYFIKQRRDHKEKSEKNGFFLNFFGSIKKKWIIYGQLWTIYGQYLRTTWRFSDIDKIISLNLLR